jgi:hypothetical protein
MSRKKKTLEGKTPDEKEEASRNVQLRLEEIARKLGTSVSELLESYGDAKTIIEKFDSGSVSLLMEREDA